MEELPEINPNQQLDWWVKIVGMLQQNWAVPIAHGPEVLVLFTNDLCEVFDCLPFADEDAAEVALRRNGFQRFSEDTAAQGFLVPPAPPFEQGEHPNGPIYSSGRFWV